MTWTPDVSDRATHELANQAVVDSVLMSLMSVGRRMRIRAPGDVLEPGSLWLLKSLHAGGMRISELAGCVGLDASTVSRHVSQLQSSGLVERTGDPEDGRALVVKITENGEATLRDAFQRRHALLARVLVGWPGDDLTQLDRLLHRFVNDVEATDNDQETSHE